MDEPMQGAVQRGEVRAGPAVAGSGRDRQTRALVLTAARDQVEVCRRDSGATVATARVAAGGPW
jgi:hypothetical protein